MNASPTPVADTATVPSSAQVPAPIMALSPTRPGGLPSRPPVDVAAARWPSTVKGYGAHRARAVVLLGWGRITGRPANGTARRRHRGKARRLSQPIGTCAGKEQGVPRGTAASPSRPAVGVLRRGRRESGRGMVVVSLRVRPATASAALTGLAGHEVGADRPGRPVAPSITLASISIMPSLFGDEPRPALNRPLSSSEATASTTAGKAAPPRSKTAQPVANAVARPASSRPLAPSSLRRSKVPAPPWTISAGGARFPDSWKNGGEDVIGPVCTQQTMKGNPDF